MRAKYRAAWAIAVMATTEATTPKTMLTVTSVERGMVEYVFDFDVWDLFAEFKLCLVRL